MSRPMKIVDVEAVVCQERQFVSVLIKATRR